MLYTFFDVVLQQHDRQSYEKGSGKSLLRCKVDVKLVWMDKHSEFA